MSYCMYNSSQLPSLKEKKIFNAEFFFSKAWLRNSNGDIRKCIHLEEEGEELKITELKNKKELVCTMKQK